jgi:uncharacterized protein (DUF2384 family)
MDSRDLNHKQLTSAGLRAFWKIAKLWQLTDQEQITLLGISRDSTLRRWRSGQVQRVGRDTLERISYVLGIYKAIHTLLPSQERANAWMRRPNKAPFLNGSSALDRMAAGNVSDLYVVRQYLEAELAR